MKAFFTVIVLLNISLFVTAQKDSPGKLLKIDNEKMNKEIDSSMKDPEALNKRLNDNYKSGVDSIYNSLEEKRNQRNLEQFMAMQKEQQAKQKKQMWIRIGLGIFFLIILIVGIMRRRKKA